MVCQLGYKFSIVFLMYVMGEAVRCELMALCQRSCDAAIRVVIGSVMTFKKDNFLGL